MTDLPTSLCRRTFLGHTLSGLGGLALGQLLGREAAAASLDPKFSGTGGHRLPKVKRVIHLCMAGGPSHLETLDWKPKSAAKERPSPETFLRCVSFGSPSFAWSLAKAPQVVHLASESETRCS